MAHTFVLVHGAWHGGWCWRRVADRLRRDGHAVFTPTLTGLGERSHLLRPGIGESKQPNDVDGGIGEDRIGSLVNGGSGNIFCSEMARLATNVVNRGDFPNIIGEHRGHKTATHPAVAEDACSDLAHGATQTMLGGSRKGHRDSRHNAKARL